MFNRHKIIKLKYYFAYFIHLTLLGHLTFMEPCIARCVFYITNETQLSALYMFRAVFPPIIRSL